MSDYTPAIKRALDAEALGPIAALDDEQMYLWTDLEHALHEALKPGTVSMGAEWIIERIVVIARITGATHWSEIPIPLILDGVYHAIYTEAGIEFEKPNLRQIQDLRIMQRRSAGLHDE